MTLYQNILETIGRTPVVRLHKLEPEGIELYAKLEYFNPMGSVKDRLAVGIVDAAEHGGELKPGQTIIEATSGNTGIGLAMVAAQRGYPLVVTMAENFSVERRRLMRFLGAKVILTPASEKGTGMLAKARELAETHGWFLARQFENEANADIHSQTTAPEIISDFEGVGPDYWVTGAGSGGTMKGVARVLKAHRPSIKVLVCEPDNAPIFASGLPQERQENGAPSKSHPNFRPHIMQGWSPDFIPLLAEDAVREKLVDAVLPVSGADALQVTRDLARKEGVFAGITSGATVAAALAAAKDMPKGSKVLCMLADTGERYQSTPLFEDIGIDMNAEEERISGSTPNYTFSPAPTAPAKEIVAEKEAIPPAVVDAFPTHAVRFVDQAISDNKSPVVMFALEWCEFCWSVRKFFKALSINFIAVDLDSVPFQKNDFGGHIRKVLATKTGATTIPQIFIGGTHVGGCTDLFQAFKDGSLQKLLNEKRIDFNSPGDIDADDFLPKWIQKRGSK